MLKFKKRYNREGRIKWKEGESMFMISMQNPIMYGAYGGIGVSNELIIHFYYERFNLPDEYSIIIDDKKQTLNSEFSKNHQLIREIKASITMNLNTAKAIHGWLGNYIKQLEEMNRT